ncbi:hypothetical protein M405DRAFT_855117 [Rhizopogon salebrosus TDB-379]|nr:hypothetical protein M405DRAFT_855117 [Rhizopogon salebrosus TDB-379]
MTTTMPQSTVSRALLFSAHLRQTQTVSSAETGSIRLKMCGLEDHGDAIVGYLGVEHRKRTTIGVELAAKPKLLLFLDEPTSGLDSQSVWVIMRFLRELSILCTIHQPSAELLQDGQTVYFGDVARGSSTMPEYFGCNDAPSM